MIPHMAKTGKGYDKIISVFFRKAYVELKSISCITIFPGLVFSSVASGSEDPGFESHAILKKIIMKKKKKKEKHTFLYYNRENLSVIISLRRKLGCKLSHVFS